MRKLPFGYAEIKSIEHSINCPVRDNKPGCNCDFLKRLRAYLNNEDIGELCIKCGGPANNCVCHAP